MNRKISMAPFAVGSDGTVFVNVAHLQVDVTVAKLIREARRMDGLLFIGIAITRPEKDVLFQALDNAGAEAVAKVVGPRLHQQKRRDRRSSLKGSR